MSFGLISTFHFLPAHHIQVGLAYDTHSQVVESSGEEAGKGRGKGNRSISASNPNANPDKILLAYEAFDVSVLIHFLDVLREGRVLHIAIQGDHLGVRGGQFSQGRAIRLPSRHLQIQISTSNIPAIIYSVTF